MEQEHIYQLIGERATCRSYRPDSIPGEILNRVLEGGARWPGPSTERAIF